MFPRLSLAVPLLALALSPALAAPFSKVFKDWEVACDNARDCVALGFEPEADRTPGSALRLVLPAGGQAKPSLTVIWEGVEINDAKLIGGLAGKPLADQLLSLARKAETATFSHGKAKATFSLAGLSATLLAVDEAQGRLGTVAAYVRSGSKPASAIPDPAPLPKAQAQPTAQLGAGDEKLVAALTRRLAAQAPDDCPRLKEEPGGEVWPLSATLSLVNVWCETFAYNATSRFFMVEQGDIAKAQPVEFRDSAGAAETLVTNGDYDPTDGTLSWIVKGRGLGDCGSQASYAWTGKAFVLKSESRLETCNGLETDWPALWRSAD